MAARTEGGTADWKGGLAVDGKSANEGTYRRDRTDAAWLGLVGHVGPMTFGRLEVRASIGGEEKSGGGVGEGGAASSVIGTARLPSAALRYGGDRRSCTGAGAVPVPVPVLVAAALLVEAARACSHTSHNGLERVSRGYAPFVSRCDR